MEEQRTKFSPYEKSEATLERKRQRGEKELECTETLATQSKPRRNTLESRGFPERAGMRQPGPPQCCALSRGPQSSPGLAFKGPSLNRLPRRKTVILLSAVWKSQVSKAEA